MKIITQPTQTIRGTVIDATCRGCGTRVEIGREDFVDLFCRGPIVCGLWQCPTCRAMVESEFQE